jgi:hypothetical protein
MTLLTAWLLTAGFVWAASVYGDRIDY